MRIGVGEEGFFSMPASLARDCLFRGGIHKPMHKPRRVCLS